MNYSSSTSKAFTLGCPTLSQQLGLCLSERQLSTLLHIPACISCLHIPKCLGFLCWQNSNSWLHTDVPLCSEEPQNTNPNLLKAWQALRTQISILTSHLLPVFTGFILKAKNLPWRGEEHFSEGAVREARGAAVRGAQQPGQQRSGIAGAQLSWGTHQGKLMQHFCWWIPCTGALGFPLWFPFHLL